jgi:hypothetical protein
LEGLVPSSKTERRRMAVLSNFPSTPVAGNTHAQRYIGRLPGGGVVSYTEPCGYCGDTSRRKYNTRSDSFGYNVAACSACHYTNFSNDVFLVFKEYSDVNGVPKVAAGWAYKDQSATDELPNPLTIRKHAKRRLNLKKLPSLKQVYDYINNGSINI